MKLTKEMFLLIDYSNESSLLVQAYTLKEAIAKAFEVDEFDEEEINHHMDRLDKYEYDTWCNRNYGYCVVLLPKKLPKI